MNKSYINNWTFELVAKNHKLDISKKIMTHINDKDTLVINKNFRYENLCNDKRILNSKYYLKIKKKKDKLWKPISIKKDCGFSLYLGNSIINNPKLNIIYFLNANIGSCSFKLLKDQFQDLINSKILLYKNLNLYCEIICSSERKKSKILQLFRDLKIENYCKLNIHFSEDKHMEYEGINKVWEIGTENNNNNTYIFYIHGKGVSYLNNKLFYIRNPIEKMLFKILIFKWQSNIQLLSRFKSITKIGALSGYCGFIWFNFWIAKGSYISKLEKPIKRTRQCYYEDWLARYELRNKSSSLEVYTSEGDVNNYYNTLNQSINILNNPKKEKYNIGSFCEVKSGDFVLGFTKINYYIWYGFLYLLNKLNLNKDNTKEKRFKN